MNVSNGTGQNSQSRRNKSEIKLSARAVSRGVAVGKIVCLHGRKRQFYRIEIKETQIERELRRFYAAVRLAKRQLKKTGAQKKEIFGEKSANILDAHLLILEDKSLLAKIEDNIKEQKVNAEWAVKVITDKYIAQYKSISDDHFRERYIDLEDIADRVLTALGGGQKRNIRLEKNSIIVAKEVKPSTLIELAQSEPKAIITENGGWTSHTFILARELNLPAVTGMKGILRRVQTGEHVVVDGYNGQVILNPSAETANKFEAAEHQFQIEKFEKFEPASGKLKTLDGNEITIRANLDLPKGYAKAKKYGAHGIGLYRSEFLFNQFKGFPSEYEQINAYRNIAELVGDEGVRIRTFDLSVELLVDEGEEKEKNPALGLRAIRLSMKRKQQFRIQLRALLQASAGNKIDIVLPMISDVSEIRRTKKILEQEKDFLRKRDIEFGNPRLGAMIEVPASVLIVEEISREVEFLCLGTNDLVQYLLAVDRDNESVAAWFRTLHPAVLRAIKMVLKAGEKFSIPIVVCGEMAGSYFYVPILIGLGANELSMNVNSIPRVRKIISGIASEEALEIVKKLEKCATADEIENLVNQSFLQKWSHLYSNNLLPSRKNSKIR
ncbi:MAG TPA: phosphoenolpyruvate--protein phosphotransferase [Pyrinomonadaceae bacterium]